MANPDVDRLVEIVLTNLPNMPVQAGASLLADVGEALIAQAEFLRQGDRPVGPEQ